MSATDANERHFTPEEITLANWLGDSEAQRILRSCIFNPPRFETRTKVYAITRDEWIVATGRRADKLRAIHDRYAEQTLSYCDDADDYRLMQAFCQMPKPDAAIMAMLRASPIVRSVKMARPVERARAA